MIIEIKILRGQIYVTQPQRVQRTPFVAWEQERVNWGSAYDKQKAVDSVMETASSFYVFVSNIYIFTIYDTKVNMSAIKITKSL